MLTQATYDPDAQRYFDQAISNGAVAGTALWKASVNNLVLWMKSKSLWPTPSTGFDAVYLWAVPDTITGRVNLVFPSLKNLTISGTPTFVAYKSIKGNSTDAVLSTGVNASSFVRFVQDSGHLSAWTLSGTGTACSIATDVSGRVRLNHLTGGFRVNSLADNVPLDTGISISGLYAADRDNAADEDSYFNGQPKSVNVLVASASRPANPIVLLKTVATFQNTEVSVAAIGSALSATKEADWYTGIRTFLLANSVAGVT